MKLYRGPNLFQTLQRVCDFNALEPEMDEIVMAVERDNTTHHVFIVEGGVGKMWGPISYHSTHNKAQKEIEKLVAMGNSKDRLRIVEQVVY